MHPPLEDFYEDILGKAKRGLGIEDEKLAKKAGISVSQLQDALSGKFDETVARKLAPVLGLSADALCRCGRKSWYPAEVKVDGVIQIRTAWEDMYVNAYLVWDEESKQAVIFDSGADAAPLKDELKKRSLSLELVLLTHAHPDHVVALPDLLSEHQKIPVYLDKRESCAVHTEQVIEGEIFQVGKLRIEARSTTGHSPGGVTYVITGLARPVAIVGDALFAGSMGGAANAWKSALSANRKKILSLPDNTVLCPGHGPMTTVAEELQNNPFYGPDSD